MSSMLFFYFYFKDEAIEVERGEIIVVRLYDY